MGVQFFLFKLLNPPQKGQLWVNALMFYQILNILVLT